MTEHEEIGWRSLLKKLVSNSRAILSNQISMPLGSLKMERIIYLIEQIKPITELNLKVFSDYNIQTSDYPIGEVRKGYNAKFLAELDIKLDNITLCFKNEVEEKCVEIIKIFGVKT